MPKIVSFGRADEPRAKSTCRSAGRALGDDDAVTRLLDDRTSTRSGARRTSRCASGRRSRSRALRIKPPPPRAATADAKPLVVHTGIRCGAGPAEPTEPSPHPRPGAAKPAPSCPPRRAARASQPLAGIAVAGRAMSTCAAAVGASARPSPWARADSAAIARARPRDTPACASARRRRRRPAGGRVGERGVERVAAVAERGDRQGEDARLSSGRPRARSALGDVRARPRRMARRRPSRAGGSRRGARSREHRRAEARRARARLLAHLAAIGSKSSPAARARGRAPAASAACAATDAAAARRGHGERSRRRPRRPRRCAAARARTVGRLDDRRVPEGPAAVAARRGAAQRAPAPAVGHVRALERAVVRQPELDDDAAARARPAGARPRSGILSR